MRKTEETGGAIGNAGRRKERSVVKRASKKAALVEAMTQNLEETRAMNSQHPHTHKKEKMWKARQI